jgi:hypothetical protein
MRWSTGLHLVALWGCVVAALAARAHADLPHPVAHWTFDEAEAEGRDSAGSHHGGDIGDGGKWIETKVNFYKDDVGTNGQGGDLELERWYLVTFVIDDGHKECRLYLDGDRKKTIPFAGQPKLMQPGRTLRIGDTGAGEHMDGVIDDVRIYKDALTDEHVRELAKNP